MEPPTKRYHHKRSPRQEGSPRGRLRHPPHLRGREIGLFYANRNKIAQATGANRSTGVDPTSIVLSESKARHIEKMLKLFEPKTSVGVEKTYAHVEDSVFKRDFLNRINQSIEEKLQTASSKIRNDNELNKRYYADLTTKEINNKTYLKMQAFRQKLPSFAMKDEILKTVEENQICVLSGETGCGKTTQVPQFILDDFINSQRGSLCKIVCTQPRRISAISVAHRVASERGEKLGESVGYHIRLESKLPRNRAAMTFCTTGIVLKIMESDPALSQISHLILDEIHERDIMSDFILALIKQVIPRRPDLKIILMSATLNAEKFSSYYDSAPHINIPGFTFPVEEFFLEDVIEMTRFDYNSSSRKYGNREGRRSMSRFCPEFNAEIDVFIRQLTSEGKYSENTLRQLRSRDSEKINLDLIFELLVHICQKDKDNGAVLIFVPGFSEISSFISNLHESGFFPQRHFAIYPLHSMMPTADQTEIFERPPAGVRKIIVATNIAETSITIDDVVHVIDSGKIKISNFNAKTNNATLEPQWVSLANASQRKGRAGRVKAGVCYHLFTRYRQMLLDQYIAPEIMRARLEDTILTAKMLQLGKVESFFATLIDCPEKECITLSLNLLKQMNALDDEEHLTPLGYHLAKLPVAPQIGKMILFGAIFGCLDPVLSVAATLDYKDPFQLVIGHEKVAEMRKLELANGVNSDHLLYHTVLKRYQENPDFRFCYYYYLSRNTIKLLLDMKQQFMGYLKEMNFVNDLNPTSHECNQNSNNMGLVKAIICAALFPNVLTSNKRGQRPRFTLDNQRTNIHPKSILSRKTMHFDSKLLVYYRKIKSSSSFIHDGTVIHPLPVIFFGDKFAINSINEDTKRAIININQSLKFKSNKQTAAIISELRTRFNSFLEWKISHPGPINWNDQNKEIQILSLIKDLVTMEDLGWDDTSDCTSDDDTSDTSSTLNGQ